MVCLSYYAPFYSRKQTCTLYRCYDIEGSLLYVGISLTFLQRLSCHKSSSWFTDIHTIKLQHFHTWGEAACAERQAILNELPKHNKDPITKM